MDPTVRSVVDFQLTTHLGVIVLLSMPSAISEIVSSMMSVLSEYCGISAIMASSVKFLLTAEAVPSASMLTCCRSAASLDLRSAVALLTAACLLSATTAVLEDRITSSGLAAAVADSSELASLWFPLPQLQGLCQAPQWDLRLGLLQWAGQSM